MITPYIQKLLDEEARLPTTEVETLQWSLLIQLMAWQEKAEHVTAAGTQRGREAQLDRAQTQVHWVRKAIEARYPQYPLATQYFFDIWKTAADRGGNIVFSTLGQKPLDDDFHNKVFPQAVGTMVVQHQKWEGEAYVMTWEQQHSEEVEITDVANDPAEKANDWHE